MPTATIATINGNYVIEYNAAQTLFRVLGPEGQTRSDFDTEVLRSQQAAVRHARKLALRDYSPESFAEAREAAYAAVDRFILRILQAALKDPTDPDYAAARQGLRDDLQAVVAMLGATQ